MPKRHKRTILMPTLEEDVKITAAAESDPDAQPLTPEQLDAMVPMRTKLPQRKPDAPPSRSRRRR